MVLRWLVRQGAIESLHVALQDQLRAARVTYVVDVGANDGQYGRLLRRLKFRGHIVSYEPVASSFEQLAAVARLDGNWEAHRCAIGDSDRVATINVTRDTVFSSLHSPNSTARDLFPVECCVAATEEVRVRRLAEVLPEVVPASEWGRTHVKVDTQGHDLSVLRSLGELIERLPSIQVELSLIPMYEGQVPYQEMLHMLHGHGFDITAVFPVARDKAMRVLEADVLLCRVEH